MAQNILYISYDGMTDPLGQSQVLPYLCGLAREGYRFTILSFEKKVNYDREATTVKAIMQQAGITWKPLFFTSRPPVLSKIYDRWNMRRTALQLMRAHRFDMVHCRSYVASEIGLAFKNKFGSKFLFDMRGFWADEKKDSGHWDLRKPLYRRIYQHYKTLENTFLKQADGIVSLTQAAADELHRQPEYAGLKINVIPCCADLQHFDYHKVTEAERAAKAAALGITPGDKIITYLGSIGTWYLTGEMFGFARQLIERYPEFKLLVLTKDKPEAVTQEAASVGIPASKLMVTYATRKELPGYLSLSDCSIFFIRPTYSKIASSPTKHAELMGMGIPVICNDIGDTGHIIRATGTGAIIDQFSDEAYARCIGELPSLLAIPKEQVRKSAFRYFDLEEGVRRYTALYAAILRNDQQPHP